MSKVDFVGIHSDDEGENRLLAGCSTVEAQYKNYTTSIQLSLGYL